MINSFLNFTRTLDVNVFVFETAQNSNLKYPINRIVPQVIRALNPIEMCLFAEQPTNVCFFKLSSFR